MLLLFSRFNKPFKLITENNDDSEDDDDKKKKDSKKNRENKEKDNKDSKDNSDDSSNIEYNNQDNLIIKLSDDLMINMFEPRIYSNFSKYIEITNKYHSLLIYFYILLYLSSIMA